MNLVLPKKIYAFLALMFFAIFMCMDLAIRLDEFPDIKTHRRDLAGGIVTFYFPFVILFSLLTPKLKTHYQIIFSTIIAVTLIFIFKAYFSTTEIIGVTLGITSNICIYIYKLFRLRRLKTNSL
jgi:hypothetical protein